MFTLVMCSESQEALSVSIYQDGRLLFVGDEIGNKAPTINIVTQLRMQGHQQKYGYLVVYPEFEFANLKGGKYNRYSANIGYVFNNQSNGVEIGFNGGWGWIDRDNFAYSSLGFATNINYRINRTLKLTSLIQLNDRKDANAVRMSFFGGLDIKL